MKQSAKLEKTKCLFALNVLIQLSDSFRGNYENNKNYILKSPRR